MMAASAGMEPVNPTMSREGETRLLDAKLQENKGDPPKSRTGTSGERAENVQGPKPKLHR